MLERNDMMMRRPDERMGAMTPYGQNPYGAPPTIEETEPGLFAAVFRHFWIVLLTLALSLGAACVYLTRAEKLYASTSRIYIEATRSSAPAEFVSAERGSYLFTQCEIIKSSPILNRLIEMPEVRALPVFSQMPNQLMYLHKHLEAEVGKRDDIINVTIESPRADESAVLVNKLVDAFIQEREERAQNSGSTIVTAMASTLQRLVLELQQTRAQIDAIKATDQMLKLTDGRNDNPALQAMLQASAALNQINLQINTAKQTWGENSVQMRNLRTQAEALDTAYRDAKVEALKTSDKQQKIDALRINEKDLQSRIDPLRTEINTLELNDKIRAQMAPVQTYESGIASLKPSSPNTAQTLGMAAVIGLVLGSMLALLRDRMDNRLRTIEEVQSIVGLPILGVIPRMPGRRTAVARAMAVHLDPRSEVSEAYRTVRTAVYFGSGQGSRAKTLLVTSPEPGDGKTTSASNLAIAIAQTGRNILLLDADFRKPTQHKNLDVKDTVGLSSVLAGMESLERAIQRTGVEGLDILPCGPIPENPSEILNSQEFGELIDRLALKYDHILFDSPPSNLVTDARILGAVCDASILVLRAEKSTRKAAEHARNSLLSVGANLLGVIVNDVPRGKGYETYGGTYYGTPEARNRKPDYSEGADNAAPTARLPRPTSDVSE